MNTNLNMFEVFPWNKSFETGNSIIDEQHQVLVALLNKLANTLINRDEAELNTALNALTNYANKHFAEEEEIWEEYFPGDPWLSSHQDTHTSFLPSIMEIKNHTADESLPDVIEKIVYYLLHWLTHHIIHTDKRMVLAIKALKTGATLDEAKRLADKEISNSEKILIDAILNMYDGLSSRTIALMREVKARAYAEKQLNEANKQLEALTITDPLTRLFNRRHLISTFNIQLRKAIRNKTALSYLLIDIDFFKSINDHYGHLAGDHALEKLGDSLRKLCRRPDDFAFRVGGEEFGVLIASHSEKETSHFAERIRKTIEDLKIPNKNSKVSDYMTASIGVIYKIPSVADNLDSFSKIVDKRLYRAKTSGRNKVVFSD